MPTPDANAVPCDPAGAPLPARQERPTFHVSRDMICFLGGIGVALGVMWLLTQINKGKH